MKKILIIEDDPIVAHIYRSRLEKEQYEVQVATDGQSGFYSIHDLEPDAVLLDLMLPKMNGVDIIRKIRSQPSRNKLPLIVFTNAFVPNMVNDAFQAGATHVFNKATLIPRQILEAIQNAIDDACNHNEHQSNRNHPGGKPLSGQETETNSAETPERTETVSAAEEQQAVDEQDEARRQFLKAAPGHFLNMRKFLQGFMKAQAEDRISQLTELYRVVHSITGAAGIAGLYNISHMAAGLEALLKELLEAPKNVTPSSLRTLAHCIDFLGDLFNRGLDLDLMLDPINILVVDDEILSRRAVTYALEKARMKCISVEDPQMALTLAAETRFDLIFLDVQMPGLDGFDLCSKIRRIEANKATPIIFVTSLTDFKSRAKSSLSGGTDYIAKPFMFIELSVKAMTYVMRSRLPQ